MTVQYEKNVPLSELSTFRMGGVAKNVVTLETDEDFFELFDTLHAGQKWFVLGGGSNIVFPDGDTDTLLIRLAPAEIKVVRDEAECVHVSAGAGCIWDDVVRFAVEHNFSGIESLSAIPGTAGGTPIQNVGAYGTEIKDVLVSVRAFDIETRQFVSFSNHGCKFGYRDSMFKHEGRGRYIITDIKLELFRRPPIIPNYPGVREYLLEKGIKNPTLADLREAITTIRWKKLPDPKDVASVGSFFKNPFIEKKAAERLALLYPSIKMFPGENNLVKIPAGWLIETAGFKGTDFGTISVYENNALVLVNKGGATREDLAKVVETITQKVKDMFGVTLESEPEMVEL